MAQKPIYSHAIGQRVQVLRKKSVLHLEVMNMSIQGEIIDIDDNNKMGKTPRPFKVRFDDGRETWWQAWELEPINQIYMDEGTTTFPVENQLADLVRYLLVHFSSEELEVTLQAALAELHEEGAASDYGILSHDCRLIGRKIHEALKLL